MRHRLLSVCAAAALTACSVQQESPVSTEQALAPTETEKLNRWFDEKYDELMRFSPLSKTFFGIKDEDYGRVDDLSDEGLDEALAWKRRAAAELTATFDYDALSEEGKDSYDFWIHLADQAVAEDAFRSNDYVFHQNSAQVLFPQLLIAQHQVASAADMEDYVSRIRELARAIRQLIVHARNAAENGIHAPYFGFDAAIEQARGLLKGRPFDASENDSPVWADVKREIAALVQQETIDDAKATELLDSAKLALQQHWKPAYESLIEWLVSDRSNAAEVASGIGSFPNSKAHYAERLAYHTTTDLTARQIHNIGLANVRRIHAEMEVIKAQVGFKGSLQEFFVMLREAKDDPRLYFPNTDEGRQSYLDGSTAAIENIKSQLPDFFGLLPKADLVVKRVESFRERPGAAQHYFPSSADGSRPGVYYAHLIDMSGMPKYDMEVIAYHEGLPGHHMQIAIANELENVPEFRKRSLVTAYVEGWGLYTEELAKEMPGTYRDPYSDFGRLKTQIWRAIRLVVDTGLHALGWTEQQAMDYMRENAPISDSQAQSEVRRYIVFPGQATSYMIGMLKIRELRERAEKALGNRFDVRAFHDTVLDQGPMPLGLLERKVDRWIAAHG